MSLPRPARVSTPQPGGTQTPKENEVQFPLKPFVIPKDLDLDRAVESVSVDGVALLKIIKHHLDAHPTSATNDFTLPTSSSSSRHAFGSYVPSSGRLVGLDVAGVLEVSDVIPLAPGALFDSQSTSHNEDGAPAAPRRGGGAAETNAALARLEEVGGDANVVGWYATIPYGAELAVPGFLDAVIAYQLGVAQRTTTRVGAAGQGTVRSAPGKGVVIVLDPSTISTGTLSLRAYRLSQSFVRAYTSGRLDVSNLLSSRLAATNILTSYPVSIRQSVLLRTFLSTLTKSTSLGQAISPSISTSAPAGFEAFSKPPSEVEKPIDGLISVMDHHSQVSLAAQQRRREQLEQKRGEQGSHSQLTPEELALMSPSRKENLCAVAAMLGAAKAVHEATALELVRAFGAQVGQGEAQGQAQSDA